jgi:tRNA(His) 5'-end guanylyltransferase
MTESLSDRMKQLEGLEAGRYFIPNIPILVRIDGKCFHSYTKKFDTPFDHELIRAMQNTTVRLMKETQALVGYTQSDEITLLFHGDTVFMNGKVHKMVSLLASMTTAFFNDEAKHFTPGKVNRIACFDCRCWQVSEKDVGYVFLWREMDAVRNSIQMVAQSMYSPTQMHKKNCDELQEMIFQKGTNWNNFPTHLKRGSYFHKVKRVRTFTPEELVKLPALHEARTNPDLRIERTDVERWELPSLLTVTNRSEMFLNTEVQVYGKETT